jgi:hypothetical protein
MFHLVGSRFFGTARDDSDWDYIGENTEENRIHCLALGLQQLENPRRFFGHGKDVYLVDNLDLHLYARELVAALPNVQQMDKATRHEKLREILDALQLQFLG